MKKAFQILITLFLLTGVIFSQSIKLSPFGVSPYDAQVDSVENYLDRTYSGLLNVGTETKVFVEAVFNDSTFVTPQWTLLSVPSGSATSFGGVKDVDASTQMNTFIPDLVGTYVVELSDGTFADTLTFNAGTYTGIPDGGFGGNGCGQCHGQTVTNWEQTDHADMFNRAMDGTLSTHYGPYCVKCHTTGYDEYANNDGFDDRDFVYPSGPDSLNANTWDMLLTTSPEAMKLANIQCETCHGPASEHFGNTMESRMVSSLDASACAVCHDDGHFHVYPAQWDVSQHANPKYSGYAGNRTSCAPCHSGSGFVKWIKGGQVNLTETPPVTAITCATCHDPHNATNDYQLRNLETSLGNGVDVIGAGTGTLCATCHKSRRDAEDYTANYLSNLSSHYGPHHGPQMDVLIGTNSATFGGEEFPTSPHFTASENACVDCHMADGAVDQVTNLQISGSHSFRMSTPDGTDNVESCEGAGCHGPIGEDFGDKKFYINGFADHDGDGTAEGLQHEVEGLLEYLESLLPQDNEGHVSINDSSITLAEAKAGYNYFMIEEDRSLGVHNPAFAIAVLKASIEAVGGMVSVAPEDGMPIEYSLSQNYPNPFNPTTQIKFSITDNNITKLSIFDALGREVAVLVNRELTSGNYSFTWDAEGMASGIYFYKLESGSFIQTQKMLLLK